MENQMDKKMEAALDTGVIQRCIGIKVSNN